MRNKWLICSLLNLSVLTMSCTSFIGCATRTEQEQTYTVLWCDDDGKVLEVDENVPKGTIPSYDGQTPQKDSTPEWSYEFNGWDKDVNQPIFENTHFTATYKPSKNHYTVTWINGEDGKVLETDTNVECGATPSYDGAIPQKDPDIFGTYDFCWQPNLTPVRSNQTYVGYFKHNIDSSISTIDVNIEEDGTNFIFSDIQIATSQKLIINWGDNAKTTNGEISHKYNKGKYTILISGAKSFIARNNDTITSVQLGDSVTSISPYAFDKCTGLTEINIPNSVTSISNEAFNYCTGLTEINIPNSVTSIDHDAFYCCTSLTNATIPNGITSIAVSAFDGCTALSEINIPNSVTSIGDNAFYGCTSLTNVTIPNGVTSIGNSAFDGCTALSEINIPNSVTTIGNSAFHDCTTLSEINIPKSVTSIGHNAFYGCTGLKTIIVDNQNSNYSSGPTKSNCIMSKDNKNLIVGCKNTQIPDTVTSIADSAFDGCTALSIINIPESVTSIGSFAFNRCTSLTQITIPNNVTSIEDDTFYDCTSLTQITIPDNVTSIGNRAFEGCIALSEINIPKSVASIGTSAFARCPGVETITVDDDNPNYSSGPTKSNCIMSKDNKNLIVGCKNTQIPYTVISIGYDAFYGCTGLTEINIPNSVTTIGNSAFHDCTTLSEINIPKSVTSIGGFAFDSCTSLTQITIPDNVTSIGEGAFYGCTSLTNVTIPNGVTSIGNSAFNSCTSLTQITIPDNVTSIGRSAFNECTALSEINIPKSVASIGTSAFARCPGVETITVDDDNQNYSSGPTKSNCIMSKDNKNLIVGCKNTQIPDTVTSIGDNAFYGCTSLTKINIPNTVTSIGKNSFRNCTGLTDTSRQSYIDKHGFWFDGTKDGWSNITKGTNWYNNCPTTKVYCEQSYDATTL